MDATSRLASSPGPPLANANVEIAMNGTLKLVTTRPPRPRWGNRNVWRIMLTPQMSSPMKMIQPRLLSGCPEARAIRVSSTTMLMVLGTKIWSAETRASPVGQRSCGS